MRAKSRGGGSELTPFLTVAGEPIYFAGDWSKGLIGSGLWSTGSAMARFLGTPHASELLQWILARKRNRLRRRHISDCSSDDNFSDLLSVLELGSGNGLVAASLLALAKGGGRRRLLSELAVTDTEDHLDLIRSTLLDSNSHLLSPGGNGDALPPEDRVDVQIVEHRWGEFLEDQGDDQGGHDDGGGAATTTLGDRVRHGRHKFDVLLGSDVAYHKALYVPLISSLARFSGTRHRGADRRHDGRYHTGILWEAPGGRVRVPAPRRSPHGTRIPGNDVRHLPRPAKGAK